MEPLRGIHLLGQLRPRERPHVDEEGGREGLDLIDVPVDGREVVLLAGGFFHGGSLGVLGTGFLEVTEASLLVEHGAAVAGVEGFDRLGLRRAAERLEQSVEVTPAHGVQEQVRLVASDRCGAAEDAQDGGEHPREA
jgi:hypothetical protein